MSKASFSELLKTSPLMRPSDQPHTLKAARGLTVFREEDGLQGKIEKRPNRSGALGGQLSMRLSGRRLGLGGVRAKGARRGFAGDPRQRGVATVGYENHYAGAAAKLVEHGKYLERDSTGPDGEPGKLYDRENDEVQGAQRLEEWANADKRHFRLMLSPESGARIEDLKDFTRATMARMERDLGYPLEWVAANHFNTDNPHVHVILRGRRRDGPEFTIPSEYVMRGLRHSMRDVATEMLGNRGPEDERLALERETRAERHTRLDKLLEQEIQPGRTVRVQAVGRKLEPVLRAALRNRVRELAHMGLAHEVKRNRFRFEPDWSSRLTEIGRSIDIRRRLGREMAPGQGKLRLYAPHMGRVAGEVLETGRRGEGKGKGYIIVRDPKRGPIFANVRLRAIDGLEPGALASIEEAVHSQRGVRVRVETLSRRPLNQQIEARAETELDREIVRALTGQKRLLPQTAAVKSALTERVAWHEREGSGRRDLTGRFEFEPGALGRMRDSELQAAEKSLADHVGKRAMRLNDGMEREWVVRGFTNLHQGRFAMLERSDAVALMRVTQNAKLAVGKAYSISMDAGKVKTAPSLGLER